MKTNHTNFRLTFKIYYLLLFLSIQSCGVNSKSDKLAALTYFIKTPNTISKNLDSAPIEDYISLLPVSESIEPWFRRHVYEARKEYSENLGKNSDFLYIGSDGSRGVITFTLDRGKKLLYVTDRNWEDAKNASNQTYLLYRVPNGWIQSDHILTPSLLENPESFPKLDYWEGVGG